MYEIGYFDTPYLDHYYQLLLEFKAESEFEIFEEQAVRGVLEYATTEEDGVGFHLLKEGIPVGIILGNATPHPFDLSKRVLSEIAWFVTKEERGSRRSLQLLEQFELYGKAIGADYVCTSLRDNLRSEKLQKFYERRGYSLTEMAYIKKV
jgi:hypothetical protein